MRCKDCGGKAEGQVRSRRADVCDGCWDTRLALVRGEIVTPGGEEFVKIQRKIACGRGTAKRFIDSCRA